MKRRIRKAMCIMLVMCLFAAMTMSCGSSSSASKASDQTETSSENTESKDSGTEAEAPVAEAEAPSGEEAEPSESNEQTENVPEEAAKPTGAAYTISDEVIVDDENCTFTITKAEDDKIWGFTLKVFCENKTEDKTLMFAIGNASVNGYMVDPAWAEEVAPGKKSNGEVTFSSSAFEDIGITAADEVIFSLRVYDSENWGDDAFVDDTFTIYPTGLTADEVTYPDRRTTSTEQVVVDNDDVTFVILDSEVDDIWGYTLHCFIENKTDKALMFAWNDVSVNGYMIDPFWAKDVTPGMRSYTDISFSEEEFEKNEIAAVEEIEYTLRAYDSNDWMDDAVYEETFTYTP